MVLQDVNILGEAEGKVYRNSVLFVQFFHKSKTSSKYKVNKNCNETPQPGLRLREQQQPSPGWYHLPKFLSMGLKGNGENDSSITDDPHQGPKGRRDWQRV